MSLCKLQAWQPGPGELLASAITTARRGQGRLSLPLATGRQGLRVITQNGTSHRPQHSRPLQLRCRLHRPACKRALHISVCSPPPTRRTSGTSTLLPAQLRVAGAPGRDADGREFFQGQSLQPSLSQGSLAPGWVTVLAPLPASPSPPQGRPVGGSGDQWLLCSREGRPCPGWGRGSSRGTGSSAPCAQDPQASRLPSTCHADKRGHCAGCRAPVSGVWGVAGWAGG